MRVSRFWVHLLTSRPGLNTASPVPENVDCEAIMPGDIDWPEDYDLVRASAFRLRWCFSGVMGQADARYSTISWSISDEISSEGDAKAGNSMRIFHRRSMEILSDAG